MVDEANWDEDIYEDVFEDICSYIDKRKRMDDSFTIVELKKMLDEAYQKRGMDWIGKGHVQFIIESATIAAMEHKFVEWEKQRKQKKNES
jgi:hypothetical protein